MKKYRDLKGLDKTELEKMKNNLYRELAQLKLSKSTSGLEKPHLLKLYKKQVARINFLLAN